jgi:tetratricopeptide (TPR) repeat protein
MAGALLLGVALACGCQQNNMPKQEDTERLVEEHTDPTPPKPPEITAKTRIAAGQLAESRGAANMAIEQYNDALKLEPNNRIATYRVALLYTNMRDFKDAVPVWNHYVELSGQSADAYNNLAVCYEMANSSADAETAYRAGIAHDPKDQHCRINYGVLLARSGRIKEALDQFQAVLTPAEAHYDLGSVYEQLGKRELARLEYKSALELNPNLADAQWRLTHME